MFGKTVEKYRSILEKSYALLQKDKGQYLFWICSKENNKVTTLGFENFYENEVEANKLMGWFKVQESKGIALSDALIYLEKETQELEDAVLGKMRPQKHKL